MVSAKELAALQGMWKGAKAQTDCNIPDGKYEFCIVEAGFRVTKNGVPQIVCKYKLVGGNEEFLNETVTINDNLQTEVNMGWFKKKLAKLGIAIPEDVTDLDSRIPGELKGKKFAGELKSKDEFYNIYVNRFIEDMDLSAGTEAAPATEAEEEQPTTEEPAEETTDALVVGDRVTFTSVKGGEIEGELIEIIEAEGKSRVKTDEGKLFKTATEKLSKVVVEAAAEETATEEEEAPAEEEESEGAAEEGSTFPTPEEVKALKLPELKQVCADNGVDAAKLKNPRMFVAGLSGFLYDPKYMPDLATLVALREGMGMKVIVNEKPMAMKARVLVNLHTKFEF